MKFSGKGPELENENGLENAKTFENGKRLKCEIWKLKHAKKINKKLKKHAKMPVFCKKLKGNTNDN